VQRQQPTLAFKISDVRDKPLLGFPSWRDLEVDAINVAQRKTSTKLLIPLHQKLRTVLDETARAHLVILTSGHGRPFSSASFGNWMAK
jgi:hypothetical protein